MSMQNMKRSETTEQIALFNWAKRTESILPELALMYHVPNEGKRSNGGILKAAGLKSGVPDICLPVANNGFHGLYIELKFGKNKATKAQEEYMAIDDVKEKVYNIAFKVYIISTLEQITSPVTVKLTNKTTGTMQTVTVTKSQMGFYVTEAGEYTVEADLESVMVTPKAFKVTNDNLMTTQNITLREGSNLGYIGNYIGSFISQ